MKKGRLLAGSSFSGARMNQTLGPNEILVSPIRSFCDSLTDKFRSAGDGAFACDRNRAAELKANGLVEYTLGVREQKSKVAPVPMNKMAPDHLSKSSDDGAGQSSSASVAAPVSTETTLKPSGNGGKRRGRPPRDALSSSTLPSE
jgi:hypothetical protein